MSSTPTNTTPTHTTPTHTTAMHTTAMHMTATYTPRLRPPRTPMSPWRTHLPRTPPTPPNRSPVSYFPDRRPVAPPTGLARPVGIVPSTLTLHIHHSRQTHSPGQPKERHRLRHHDCSVRPAMATNQKCCPPAQPATGKTDGQHGAPPGRDAART